MTPQATIVLRHLEQHGSITNVEANAVHKVRSVSRRISEIADAGYNITKEFKADATGQRYVRYALALSSRPLEVGDRVVVTGVDPVDAEFYSIGASGTVQEVDGDDVYVHFTSGKFLRKWDHCWYVGSNQLLRV